MIGRVPRCALAHVCVASVLACMGEPRGAAQVDTAAGTTLADRSLALRDRQPDTAGAPPLPAPASPYAESLYWAGEYDAARATWRATLSNGTVRDSAEVSEVLTWLGLAAWRRGDHAEARIVGVRALRLKQRHGLRRGLSRSYNALGLLDWNEGRLGEAAALFDSAALAARSVGDAAGVAKAAGNMALVSTELGRFDEARRGFALARDAGRRLGDRRIEGNALANLAMLAVKTGEPLAAVAIVDTVRHVFRGEEFSVGEHNAIGQLGTAWDALGEPQRALAAFDSALRLARQHGLRQEEASNLQLIAEVLHEMGDLRRSLEVYAQAESLNAELGLRVEQGIVERQRAMVFAALGQHASALRQAGVALATHRGAGARFEVLFDLLAIAELAAGDRRPAQATTALREARAVARELGGARATAEVALVEARVAEMEGRPADVLSALASLRPDSGRLYDDVRWETHARAARAHLALGALDSAIAEGRAAIAAVERVRTRIGAGSLRTAYLSRRSSAYADLALALLRARRTDEAFEVADRARGRALIDHLAAARRDVAAAGGAIAGASEADRLLREIDGLVARLRELERTDPKERGAVTEGAPAIAERLERARKEYEVLAIRTARDPSAALVGAVPVRAEAVRRALEPDEVLLEYLLTPDTLRIFVVRRDGLWQLERPVSRSDLASRARLALELVSRRDWSPRTGIPVLASLHDDLLDVVARAGLLHGVQRLLLVPHDAITYVPFAALYDRRTSRWLVQDRSIVVLPSASALPALRDAKPVARRARIAAFAPFTATLPATRPEARAVGSAGGGEVALDDDASESALRAALGRGDLVHVATHGVLNARSPMFSRLELARGTGDTSDDGRLEVHELLAIRTTSPLIFLSGCETNLGAGWSTSHGAGEDFTTLGQALLYGGARNVVGTLWRVDDEGAATFARAFYDRLDGGDAGTALADAQRRMIERGPYGAPYYWAAYRLVGADREQVRLRGRWRGLLGG